MWYYHNPVKVRLGVGALDQIADIIAGRRYCLVTYDTPIFDDLGERIRNLAGPPALVVNDIRPNPDFAHLDASCARFGGVTPRPLVIVAVGGGSVMDTAKVISASDGDFARVRKFLETGDGEEALSSVPIIAVPTTAGTGSEMTCWGTVWHAAAEKKYSLARTALYPEWALVDPELTLSAPLLLTTHTGLDAMSHALESIWNINRNPVSTGLAVAAARTMMSALPDLAEDLGNITLRTRMAKAALLAGKAFSNTKTALAHNLSYPLTLRHGIPHGLACSFTLPQIMRAVTGISTDCDEALAAIFGEDLRKGADRLEAFLTRLGVSVSKNDYGVDDNEWLEIVDMAFAGERGRNFIGTKEQFAKFSA